MSNKPKHDWEVLLSVEDPNVRRPRRLSIHAIAALCERDPFVILDEMEKSDLVDGYRCGTIGTSQLFLKSLSHIHGRSYNSPGETPFTRAKAELERVSFDKFKGFGYNAAGPIATPLEAKDAAYKAAIEKALADFRNQ